MADRRGHHIEIEIETTAATMWRGKSEAKYQNIHNRWVVLFSGLIRHCKHGKTEELSKNTQ